MDPFWTHFKMEQTYIKTTPCNSHATVIGTCKMLVINFKKSVICTLICMIGKLITNIKLLNSPLTS